MRLSINLPYVAGPRFGGREYAFPEAAARCRDAGFRVLDVTPKLADDGWRARVAADAAAIRNMGMDISQTHAPYNRYKKAPAEEFAELFRRAFEAAHVMGVRQIVVHGDEYRDYADGFDPAAACDHMYGFLAPYADLAARNGFSVAIENLFEETDVASEKERSRFTSRVEELLALVDRFGDAKTVGVCWDFGHAHVAFGDGMLEELKKVGGRLIATHVHDNYYRRDLHLPPFAGDVDWESHMRYLAQIGYAGDLTYELVYGRLPEALTADFLSDLARRGQILFSMQEAHE